MFGAARLRTLLMVAPLTGLGPLPLALTACSTGPEGSDSATAAGPLDAREVRPADFVRGGPGGREPQARVDGQSATPMLTPPDSVLVETGAQVPSDRDGLEPTPSANSVATPSPRPPALIGAAADQPYLLGGMIGQINGQPVYADDVLRDISDQLRVLGEQQDRAAFATRARELVDGAVRARLRDALILGEAERALTPREQQIVQLEVARKREDLVRQNGRGSLAVAERRLLEDTGYALSETLERFRDSAVTDLYIQRNLRNQINVTRRDIERYYRDRPNDFNPPASRDLRLILPRDAAGAEQVEAALAAGEPFDDVASGPLNAYPDGGRVEGLVGDAPLRYPEWNDAVDGLAIGEVAGPIQGGRQPLWVKLVGETQAAGVDLLDAQASIREELSKSQYLELWQRFLERLQQEGSFDDPDLMIERLMEITTNLYGPR